jgi:hypothetical protein
MCYESIVRCLRVCVKVLGVFMWGRGIFERGLSGFCDPGVDKSAVLSVCSLRSQDLRTFISTQRDYKHINDTNSEHYHHLITIIIKRFKQLSHI